MRKNLIFIMKFKTMKHIKKFNESKFNENDFRDKVAKSVASGGWSSIREIINHVPLQDLRDLYNHLLDENDTERYPLL